MNVNILHTHTTQPGHPAWICCPSFFQPFTLTGTLRAATGIVCVSPILCYISPVESGPNTEISNPVNAWNLACSCMMSYISLKNFKTTWEIPYFVQLIKHLPDEWKHLP